MLLLAISFIRLIIKKIVSLSGSDRQTLEIHQFYQPRQKEEKSQEPRNLDSERETFDGIDSREKGKESVSPRIERKLDAWNDKWISGLDYTPLEIHGNHVRDLMDGEARSCVENLRRESPVDRTFHEWFVNESR